MKLFAVLVSCCVLVFDAALGTDFVFRNQRDSTVWIGSLSNDGGTPPQGGGFVVDAQAEVTVTTEDTWVGRFWARTGCDDTTGHCETGDCGNGLACNGAGGAPPITLVEVNLAAQPNFYDVSLVDGFNVAIQMSPQNSAQDPNNQYNCGTAGCTGDLNADCPDELRQTNSAGATVACKSACTAFNTDQYCCRGSFNTPSTCMSSDWPVNFAGYFKANCPNAYSYAYDDFKSTYTCSDSAYVITIY